jgi:hypothetical protein
VIKVTAMPVTKPSVSRKPNCLLVIVAPSLNCEGPYSVWAPSQGVSLAVINEAIPRKDSRTGDKSDPQFGQSTVPIGRNLAAVGRGLQVQHMKRGTTAIIVLLAFAISLATVSAFAQDMGGGHKHQKQTDKTEPQKRKADDGAYNAALKSLPDKPKLDRWQGAR